MVRSASRTKSLSLWEVLFISLVALFVGAYFFGARAERQPFVSSEARFTELSAQGLDIVPASCPSNPHYEGECSGVNCTAGYICIGNDRYYRNAQCQDSFVQECAAGCVDGECIDQDGMVFQPFNATDIYGQQFLASGRLQVRASLVRLGEPTRVYWNVVNAASCTVTNDLDDTVWTGTFSGASGRTTPNITEQTTFTLNCTALEGVVPPTLSDSDTVNVIPVFEEE